ncbi:helix-turn-helix transcriptional regulator [Candidatus Falkowbacteria bacterium]|nr:helix-turn-helix transcriptional regulator [Candidatus Falkowbacteria bacterium]
MANKKENITTCPVEKTLKIIGKKYAVLIIRDLLSGKKRFGQLLHSLKGVSPRTLSARLDELEKDKIIRKKVFPVMPPHVEYSLTTSGSELHAIIDQMGNWGTAHHK